VPGRRLALAAALALALACHAREESPAAAPAAPAPSASAFVASSACAECHPEQSAKWAGSHHDRAMQLADEHTVLGDFGGVDFTQAGVATRFFRRDGKPYVNAEDAAGHAADFAVRYTFGVDPLQQLLLDGPDGRLQALSVAWDTEKRRWFSLYPGEHFAPGDPLHWTGRYQSWNAMCADCHSTGVEKGYDAERDAYRTRWAELDVGCQACHGPGAAHVAWARARAAGAASGEAGNGLVVHLGAQDAGAAVESCAPCHARRSRIRGEASWQGRPFLDDFLPATLREGLYHADGQIDGEVYEYGSFVQSRMYARGVRCTDCHDPHSGKLAAEGNALCTRCHQPSPPERFPTLRKKEYDATSHHHHPVGSAGAQCVSCHMPAKKYMVIDARQDHAIRVPRPDLSEALGTPNACNACHADRTPAWAAAAVTRWYGPERRREPHWGEAIAAGRRGAPDAESRLVALAGDREAPAIARATALELLAPSDPAGIAALAAAARDGDPLVRASAAGALDRASAESRLAVALPLLGDPVRAVRIAAARSLAPVPRDRLHPAQRAALERGLAEYEDAQRAQGDLPAAHLNLGSLEASLGHAERAEQEYRTALRMDPGFLPASVNLANALDAAGRPADAERELRAALAHAPEEGELHYSLGLVLAEQGRLADAVESLAQAAARLPARARVRYNRGLALQQLGRRDEAGADLAAAERLDPHDPEIAYALALFYAQGGDYERARAMAQHLVELAPDAPGAKDLLARIEAKRATGAADP